MRPFSLCLMTYAATVQAWENGTEMVESSRLEPPENERRSPARRWRPRCRSKGPRKNNFPFLRAPQGYHRTAVEMAATAVQAGYYGRFRGSVKKSDCIPQAGSLQIEETGRHGPAGEPVADKS